MSYYEGHSRGNPASGRRRIPYANVRPRAPREHPHGHSAEPRPYGHSSSPLTTGVQGNAPRVYLTQPVQHRYPSAHSSPPHYSTPYMNPPHSNSLPNLNHGHNMGYAPSSSIHSSRHSPASLTRGSAPRMPVPMPQQQPRSNRYAHGGHAPVPPYAAAPVPAAPIQNDRPYPPTAARNQGTTAPYRYQCDPKGYLIFDTGMILNNRYRLEKRIGKGTFSKVFAALDIVTDNWVAVKVVRNAEKYQLAAKVELHILNMITEKDPDDKSNCIHLLDQFVYEGHPCFVFDLLGRNLYSFLHTNRYLPFALSHVKSFVRQILEAVSFLHQRNVIFTDLKPENIVFVFDKTVKRYIQGMNIEIPKDTRIRLIDFGSALYGDRHHTHLVQTRHYRAPEVILGIPWRFPVDIWSVGCIILELLTGRMVFNTHDSVDHLNQMERLIDPMPQSLKRKAANFSELFHNDFTLRLETARISPTQCVRLHEYFSQVLYMYPRLEVLHDLVKRMLMWNAADRITAAEALAHPYFREC